MIWLLLSPWACMLVTCESGISEGIGGAWPGVLGGMPGAWPGAPGAALGGVPAPLGGARGGMPGGMPACSGSLGFFLKMSVMAMESALFVWFSDW